MPIGIDDEGGKIIRAIVRSKTWRPIVRAAMSQCSCMEMNDGISAWCSEGEMKARAWRTSLFAPQFDRELIAPTGHTISYGLIGIAGTQVVPDPDIAERGEGCVVERSGFLDIRDTE